METNHCVYCKKDLTSDHEKYLVRVEFPLRTGEIELRDVGLACTHCIIDKQCPLIMECELKTERVVQAQAS